MLPSHNEAWACQNTHIDNGNNNFENISASRSEAKSRIWTTSIAAAVFYGMCSCSMAFINKAVISSYKFNFPFFIMSCQMLLTILILEVLRLKSFIILSSYTFKKGWFFLWPSFFYAVHSITALTALSGMTIPMYGAIKRCAPFATVILSTVFFYSRMPSIRICISVCVITVGCVIAGTGDLSFDILAYGYGLISVIAQSLYLLLVQHNAENMSTLEILQLNSYNTVLFFVLISLITEEFNYIMHFHDFTDFGFFGCFLAELCFGCILNYSLFLCTTLNSALTTTLVGVMKSVVQTSIGFVTFDGVKFHPLNIAGLILNMCGGFIYTHAKYMEKQENNVSTVGEKQEIIPRCYISNGVHHKLSLDQGCKTCL